jgi:hypothetical protein
MSARDAEMLTGVQQSAGVSAIGLGWIWHRDLPSPGLAFICGMHNKIRDGKVIDMDD